MSDRPPRFRELAAQAGREPPPPIDMACAVVRSIAARSRSPARAELPGERLWWWSAAAALALAVLVLWFVSQQGVLWEDPLEPWLRSLALVM